MIDSVLSNYHPEKVFDEQKATLDQMTDEEFNAEMGGNLKHVMSYYYKEDKYKSVLEETQATVLYEPTEMKIYSYTVGQLEGGWFDAKEGVHAFYFEGVVQIKTRVHGVERLDQDHLVPDC